AITASVERSLRRLRVNNADAVLLHSDGRDEWILKESGALDALSRLKKKGMIRAMGISTKTASGALLATTLADVLMVTLNPDDLSNLPAIRAAGERGVGVLIKKAFASGHAVAGEAFRLCFAEPGVSSVVIGTISPSHLEENARAAERTIERVHAERTDEAR
ncbi:MAG: aldo/keto reductase, partial [Phycisphaerae bacterium]|nr:aldo/keto reductase [Phycisphaerae bacterium]